MKRLTAVILLTGAVAFAACAEDQQDPVAPDGEVTNAVNGAAKGAVGGSTPFTTDPAAKQEIEARLTDYVKRKAAEIEAMRAEAGVVAPAVAPLGFYWTGYVDGETVGAEVVFEDRGNKRLPIQWVPGDPRRLGRTDIGYAYDQLGIIGNYTTPNVTASETFAAIDRAIATWEDETCSSGLTIPLGTFVEWLFFESDVLHQGYFPLGPGVLGVTSIFVFVDADGPTDIDSDGNLDYAFAVITYNSQFPWAIDGNIDVETVALHEMGHGLAQAHFGKAFITTANNRVHFSPRSVMNAGYSGVQQSLTGTDRAGHCGMYGSWPNN